jgi:hypothetical protein
MPEHNERDSLFTVTSPQAADVLCTPERFSPRRSHLLSLSFPYLRFPQPLHVPVMGAVNFTVEMCQSD